MLINPKFFDEIKKTGFTCKEMADGMRKMWEGLPTTKQLANNFYANLKYWRSKT